MTRVAALDCGTNSVRLLVADLADGELTDVVRELRVVRLGQGVDRTGELAPEALARTRTALEAYARTCAELGVARTRVVATSAVRDARNREAFHALVHELLGVEPEVASGDEEAALTFAGATAGLPPEDGPFLVVDVGGGSTELVVGAAAVEAGVSVDVGSVRLTERHLVADPSTAAQRTAALADVDTALDAAAARVPLQRARLVVAVAGTATTLAAHLLRLPAYDPARVHRSRFGAADVLAGCAELIAMTSAQRGALPYVQPGREDVLGGGALVLGRVVERAGAPEVLVSETDVLDGIARTLA